MVVEELWAILGTDNQLACWRGSQGVPFMSPSPELVKSTLLDPDVIDLPQGGQVVQVRAVAMDDHVFVLQENTLLAVLSATNRCSKTSNPSA
jgi:hypothetical protein